MMAASRRVRIADVAAHAGAGVGTVSRVLNRSPHVSDSTRQRVLEAIEATRYRPSRLAADLSTGTPRSVAILVPLITGPSVVARLAAGVLVTPVDVAARGVPHTVVDDVRGGAGLPVDPGLVRRGRPGSAAAAELAAGLLRQSDRPTAIFAASDTQAVGVLSAADATGLRVPRDLSVIGFDDIDTAAQWSLSTIRQPLRDSGTRGAVRLGRLLRGELVRPLREVLPLELIVRGSTTAACGRRTADWAGPAQPEPAGSRSRPSLARAQ